VDSSTVSGSQHHPAWRGAWALAVPDGWVSVKSHLYRSADGRFEMAHLERSGTVGRGVADLARQHLEEVASQGGELIDSTVQATALGGRPVTLQTFEVPADGSRPTEIRAAYHVADDIETVVAVSTTAVTETDAATAERFLRTYDPWPLDVDQVVVGRGTVLGTFTSHELLAVAGLVGVDALPSIIEDSATVVDMSLVGLLIDRGLVGVDEAGQATVSPMLERAMRTIAAPDMVVIIETGPRGRTRRTVMHVDPGSLLSVRQLDDDAFQVVTDSADGLDAHLIHHLALRDVEAGEQEPGLVDSSVVERVRMGEFSDDVATMVVATGRRVARVRVLAGVPGGAAGDELTFVDGGSHGYWLVELTDDVTSPTFVCRPIGAAELNRSILALTAHSDPAGP
jgi:hypothetical protein